MTVSVPLRQVQIVIPDLAAVCPFPLKVSPLYQAASVECRKWFFQSDPTPTDEKRAEYDSLNPALLAAVVYPDADDPRLQACIDFLAYIFYLDNLTDDMDNKGSRTVGDVIMNSFHHPSTSKSSVRLAVMGSEYVLFWEVLCVYTLTISSSALSKGSIPLPKTDVDVASWRLSTCFFRVSTNKLATVPQIKSHLLRSTSVFVEILLDAALVGP
jgi:hypothetical protein